MAKNRTQVSYGSQGGDVTELQKMLNRNGYSLKEDGIFGDRTQEAVRDYQGKNNLDVDGIVGEKTWGSLNKGSGNKNNSNKNDTNNSSANTGFQYDAYTESDIVKQAQALLQQQIANKPGEYVSPWQAQLNAAIDKIMNREQFTYDLNGDALYNQYKDQYVTQGQMAMMDTMGQASAMTGGYGNSYAQTVGQQVYQGYLQNLNDKVPELYQLALNKYQMDGDALYDQYALLRAQDDQAYGQYRDKVSDYNTELDRLLNQYYTERDFDYGKYTDGRDFSYGQYVDDRNFQYQQERDAIADQQWQAEFNEAIRQWQAQYDATYGATSSSGGGGGSSGGSSGVSAAYTKALAALYDFTNPTHRSTLDMNSVNALNRGPISGDELARLVATGEVKATDNGETIVVENVPAAPKAPTLLDIYLNGGGLL